MWLSSVAAEALRAKQMAGDRFSSLLHHLHMWLRFEYTNFDAVRQKKKNLWQSYCSYLYSCT